MNRTLVCLCIICIIVTLSGCGDDELTLTTQAEGSVTSMINIYYPADNKVDIADEKYQLRQPDVMTAAIEEIMTEYTDYMDDSISYYTYMTDEDGNVTLDFTLNTEYDTEYYLLLRASVSKNLFQISSVKSLSIRLSDLNGNEIETHYISDDTFYYTDYPEEFTDAVDVVLYTKKKNSLDKVLINVPLEDNCSLEEKIVDLLIDYNSIPSATEVNNVIINNGVCYLDLSEGFLGDTTYARITLYSIVDSIIMSHADVNSVVISIDGEKLDSFHDLQIDNPLTYEDITSKN